MRWWTFLKGGAKYVAAARLDDAARRGHARACSGCPHLKVFAEDELDAATRAAFSAYGIVSEVGYKPYTAWCGEPGDEVDGGPCGCLVGAEAPPGTTVDITLRGRPMRGAGRADSAGYHCPLPEPERAW